MEKRAKREIPKDRPLRLVFMGTPEFAVPTLEALLRGPHRVVSVYTQPDKPQGRGQKWVAPPVKIAAQAAGIPVYQPEKMTTAEALERFQADQPDLAVVVAYGKILRKRILDVPPLGCINSHASLLPFYRGAAPIYWVLAKGERETGITTMQMDEGMDTGAILIRRSLAIGEDETIGSLHDRLAALSAEVMVETLEEWVAGRLEAVEQEGEKATYAPMLKREDSWLDLEKPGLAIHNHIRASDPFPGVKCLLPDGTGVKLFGSSFRPERSGKAGEIMAVGGEGLLLGTGEGAVLIREIQKEGRRRMTVKEFVAGHPLRVGEVFRAFRGDSNEDGGKG